MGILDDNHSDDREQVVEMLKKAYWMEIETVMSYIANSINPDGVRAREVIDSLNQDIQEELGHAQLFGKRIKELYGVVPGSSDFNAEQKNYHVDLVFKGSERATVTAGLAALKEPAGPDLLQVSEVLSGEVLRVKDSTKPIYEILPLAKSKDFEFFGVDVLVWSPGNTNLSVFMYPRRSPRWRAARPNSVRSYAEEYCPSASRPLGFTTVVS